MSWPSHVCPLGNALNSTKLFRQVEKNSSASSTSKQKKRIVIFSKLRKMSLYTLDIARSDHRVMAEGFVFINLSFGKPCNFVIQLFNPALCHLINLKKKFHLSIFYLSAFNLPACHFLLLFRRMMTQKILQPDFYIHCSTASSYVQDNGIQFSTIAILSLKSLQCVLSTKNTLTRKLSSNGHPL